MSIKKDSSDTCFYQEAIRKNKINALLDTLNIPHDGRMVWSSDLYDIFMDQKRFNEFVSKIRNKAFW